MPTGYTSDVADGKITTLYAFTLRCARAFGALAEMRDEALDKPIPESFKASNWHRGQAAKARARLARVLSISPRDAARKARRMDEADLHKWEESRKRMQRMRARYERMVALVEAWLPATPDHRPLKEFTLDQLRQSISIDCPVDFHTRAYLRPKPRNGTVWLREQIASARTDVAHHDEQQRKEDERTAKCNAWISALRASLPKRRAA